MEEVRQWMDGEGKVSETSRPEAEVLSGIVTSIWDSSGKSDEFSGYQGFPFERGPGTVVWRKTGNGIALLVAGPLYMERQWLAELSPLLLSQNVHLAFQDTRERPASVQEDYFLTADSTGLPWSVLVNREDPDAGLITPNRRHLFMAGLNEHGLVVGASPSCEETVDTIAGEAEDVPHVPGPQPVKQVISDGLFRHLYPS